MGIKTAPKIEPFADLRRRDERPGNQKRQQRKEKHRATRCSPRSITTRDALALHRASLLPPSPSPPLPHRILVPPGLFSTPVSLSLSVACFSRSLSTSTRTSNRSRQGQGQGQGARSQEMSRQGGGRYCSAPRSFRQTFSQVRKVGVWRGIESKSCPCGFPYLP